MASEESRLDALKAQMSDQQRRDMAEIIGNELKRREMEKQTSKQRTKSAVNSSGLSGGALKPDQVKELYGEVNDAVKQLRLKKLEGQLKEARAQEKHLKKASKPKTSAMASADLSAASSGALPSPVAMTSGLQRLAQGMNSLPTGKIFFLYALVAVGVAKVVFSTGLVDASISASSAPKGDVVQQVTQPVSAPEKALPATEAVKPQAEMVASSGGWSPAETQLLTKLDERRVELERRREALDSREAELKNQAQILSEKLAELRSLTGKLEALRKSRDSRYEARLEQLANVYGSMPPADAAPLIARLDDKIALELLERLPGKRMGQILSGMDGQRAIDLTKLMTDKRQLD